MITSRWFFLAVLLAVPAGRALAGDYPIPFAERQPAPADSSEWLEYANFERPYWATDRGPERATRFQPLDFLIGDPYRLLRVRAAFHELENDPWADSTLLFRVYNGVGDSLLHETDSIDVLPGWVVVVEESLDAVLEFEPGEPVMIAVVPAGGSHPSSVGDSVWQGHSYSGGSGAWEPWPLGELLISIDIEIIPPGVEQVRTLPSRPVLEVINYPNPAGEITTIAWQTPSTGRVKVKLYDATGRLLRVLHSRNTGGRGELVLDARSLSPGIYLVRLETDVGTATRKLVLR